MAALIDTDVAIHLRDGDDWVARRFADLPDPPLLSLVSLVELNGGLVGNDLIARVRRERLAEMLRNIEVVAFDRSVVDTYSRIIASIGFSRRRTLDRLIAATAIVHDLTLITINGADFRDIPDLKLEVWPRPPQ